MEDCSAMHFCWTISPLHRQKLILASAKAQPIWDCLQWTNPSPTAFNIELNHIVTECVVMINWNYMYLQHDPVFESETAECEYVFSWRTRSACPQKVHLCHTLIINDRNDKVCLCMAFILILCKLSLKLTLVDEDLRNSAQWAKCSHDTLVKN